MYILMLFPVVLDRALEKITIVRDYWYMFSWNMLVRDCMSIEARRQLNILNRILKSYPHQY